MSRALRLQLLLGLFGAMLAACASAQAAAPNPYLPLAESIGTPAGAFAVDPDSGDVFVETGKRTVTVYDGEAPHAQVTTFVAPGLRDHANGIRWFGFDGSGRLFVYGQDASNKNVVGVYEADGDELAVLALPESGTLDRWFADPANGAIYGTDQAAVEGAGRSYLYEIRGTEPIVRTEVSVSGGTSFLAPDAARGNVFQLVTATATLRVLDGETLAPVGGQTLDLSSRPLGASLAVAYDDVAERLFLLQRRPPSADAWVRVFDVSDPAAMVELDPVDLPGASATVQSMALEAETGSLVVSHGLSEATSAGALALSVIDSRAAQPALVQEAFSVGFPEAAAASGGRLVVKGRFSEGSSQVSLVPFGRLALEVDPVAEVLDGQDLDVTVDNVPLGQGVYVNFCEDPVAAGQRTQAAGLRCAQEGGGTGFPTGAWVVSEVPDGGPPHDGASVIEPGETFSLPAPASFTGSAGAAVDCIAESCGVFVTRDSRDPADPSLDLFTAVGFDVPEPPATVNGGYADWGMRESFRLYINGQIAKGQVALAGGASANPDGTYRFPVEEGVHDPDGEGTEVDLAGSVHFTGHDHGSGPELDLTVSNPRIELDGPAGTLYADVVSRDLTSGSFQSFPGVDLATLDVSGVTPLPGEETLTWSSIPATLTANGVPAFAGFYVAGTALDPVTLVADFGPEEPDPVGPTGPTGPTGPDGPSDPGGTGGAPPTHGSPGPAPAQPAPLLRQTGANAKLQRNGVAAVATVVCRGTALCVLATPKRVRVKIAGKAYWAKVIAPRSIRAKGKATVKVKLPRKALRALGKRTARASLRVAVRSGGSDTERVLRVKLSKGARTVV